MKVLGLDIGPASLGWSLVDFSSEFTQVAIIAMGSRIIPYSEDSVVGDFNAGKGETACSIRRVFRQMRRNLDRWQLHREQLKDVLIQAGIMQDKESFPNLHTLDVWKLRANAASPENQITLSELARVLLHINHRRGYKHAKSDAGDSKQSEYLSGINQRFKEITEANVTVGEYFYRNILDSEHISPKGKKCYSYRVKEKIFPRAAYFQEVDTILEAQSRFYPDVLTTEVKDKIKQVIFYQRPLKSCKHLVSLCEFEKRQLTDSNGNQKEIGPRVAPKTSPLAQLCRIYEAINNISLTNPRIKENRKVFEPSLFDDPANFPKQARKLQHKYDINAAERQLIADYMQVNEKITLTELFKLLGLKKSDGFQGDKLIAKGIKGNETAVQIRKALSNLPQDKIDELMRFNIEFAEDVNKETGEVYKVISSAYEREPLYMLWHTLYSIDDRDVLLKVLQNKFGIQDEKTLERLFALDFVKAGYSNKSSKFMRRILPSLMDGMKYNVACERIGVNHSNSITKEQNDQRVLVDKILPLSNGELRQPVVEKVINQVVNLVNEVKAKYGEIDEVRVELARELKQSKEDRAQTTSALSKLEKDNNRYAEEIKELGLVPTRRRIQKMKMLKETENRCIYCGALVSPTQFIDGHGYEIEHIIPRSRLFDDSFANKVCACHECNASKGNKTGYDFMEGKTESEFNSYKERVIGMWTSGRISKRKKDYLLMPESKIPSDFLNRDLNETQYITRKVMEVLRSGFRNVWASSGSVTDFFRHVWGYDNILHDLNLPKYRDAGLTEDVQYESHGQTHTAHRIKDWTKRNDHRHHAVDALVVALTRQAHVKRLNDLNQVDRDSLGYEISKKNLEKWGAEQTHPSVEEASREVEKISVSFKGGKKLATPGKRCTDRNGNVRRTLVPRAALHKETVYGEILVAAGDKTLKDAYKDLTLVVDKTLREQLYGRLQECDNDLAATLKSLKKNPLMKGDEPVQRVACFKREIVVRYPIASIARKDIDSIVDSRIRELIRDRYKTVANEKEFQRSLSESPIYSDPSNTHKISHVRCFTGLKPETLATVAKNSDGKGIGFSQTRNNHHMAIYVDSEGNYSHLVTSFWECIKRKRYGLPIIVTDPAEAWDALVNCEENEDIEEIAKGMPAPDSQFVMSLQRNEMVVLGMSDDQWNDAVANNDVKEINKYLYRVWKIAVTEYCFKYHTNTTAAVKEGDKEIRAHYKLASLGALFALNPRKVRINSLGELIL